MKSITFKLPGGVEVPDGTESGDTFQAMTTYKMMANGDVQLMEVDGESIDSSQSEDESPNLAATDDATQPAPPSMMQRLMGGQ